MKRIASISTIVAAAALGGGVIPVAASEFRPVWERRAIIAPEPRATKSRVANRHAQPDERKANRRKAKADTDPIIPQGPLHIVVSIDKQRVTLFADGKPVTSAAVSTGTPHYPTPMGVFGVIQKRRHHVSNLYGAEMPYMQRLTWSGTALHQGPLPGRPASHGCIRLSGEFARLLWKTTKIGARVIVTRGEAAPVEFDMPWRFVPEPKVAEAPRAMMAAAMPAAVGAIPGSTPNAEAALVKTAAAADVLPGVMLRGVSRPIISEPETNGAAPAQASKATVDVKGAVELIAMVEPAQPPAQPVPESDEGQPVPTEPETVPLPLPAPPQAKRSTDPVSVFISRKSGRLYVRQKWKLLFDAPVTVANSDRPLGTHVYTAMGTKDDAMRWTAISIPSSPGRADGHKKAEQDKKTKRGKKHKREKPAVETAAVIAEPTAHAALDRIAIPPDTIERIAALLMPGSSIIVSDNKLSDETGEYTDFIVITP